MSGQPTEKLAYMVNQIARNMALDKHPAASVADHVTAFWTPIMIDMLLSQQHVGLDPVAADAMQRIAGGRMNRTTNPAIHGSDAG